MLLWLSCAPFSNLLFTKEHVSLIYLLRTAEQLAGGIKKVVATNPSLLVFMQLVHKASQITEFILSQRWGRLPVGW